MNDRDYLTLLGSKVSYPNSPEDAVIETISNTILDHDYVVNLTCLEFACLCPKTSQPDFATITINYVPNQTLIESKSLKLYLFSFRNYGIFHEFVINKIATDLQSHLNSKFLKIDGKFVQRGGISINPVVRLGDYDCGKLFEIF